MASAPPKTKSSTLFWWPPPCRPPVSLLHQIGGCKLTLTSCHEKVKSKLTSCHTPVSHCVPSWQGPCIQICRGEWTPVRQSAQGPLVVKHPRLACCNAECSSQVQSLVAGNQHAPLSSVPSATLCCCRLLPAAVCWPCACWCACVPAQGAG